MTDIVERLIRDADHHREVANDCDCRPEHTANWQHMINAQEAADEIVRLRGDAQAVGSPSATAQSNPLRDALLPGFLSTSTSGDGGRHTITIEFETLEKMQEARKELYHAIRYRSLVSSTVLCTCGADDGDPLDHHDISCPAAVAGTERGTPLCEICGQRPGKHDAQFEGFACDECKSQWTETVVADDTPTVSRPTEGK
jgi:hypothetical protein